MINLKRRLFAGLMMVLVGGLLAVAALGWVERRSERLESMAALETAMLKEAATGTASADVDSAQALAPVSRP